MKITFLGTGTSNGIPLLACSCPVCTSADPHNKRLRASVLITDTQGQNILIDASSDFRQQALRHTIQDIATILITHVHADHVFGLDEMRRYNQLYKKRIPLYIKKEFDPELKRLFSYIYEKPLQVGGGVSEFDNRQAVHGQPIIIGELTITPLEIMHGILPIFGYRINDFAYLTDCSAIPETTYALLKGVKVAVIDALRPVPHPTHFSVEQAVAAAHRIGVEKAYFTHIAHGLEHAETNARLPANMQLAYDGLEITI
jgi:phosphoribosyl 1,2-cyclic phosphate phosphodiesterase